MSSQSWYQQKQSYVLSVICLIDADVNACKNNDLK